MGIVLKVVHADKTVSTLDLGGKENLAFQKGDEVSVGNIKGLKDVDVDKDGNLILTFADGKVVLSNLSKEQVEALMDQLPGECQEFRVRACC